MIGVILAIAFGKRRTQLHEWEEIRGVWWIGVLFGLAAAGAQSVASIIARPVMAAGADPVAASALRVGVAVLGLMLLVRVPMAGFQTTQSCHMAELRTDRSVGFARYGDRHDVDPLRAQRWQGRYCFHPFSRIAGFDFAAFVVAH